MQGRKALLLPLVFTLGVAGISLVPASRQSPKVFWSLLGVSLFLAAMERGARVDDCERGRILATQTVLLRQHYMQACIQGSLLFVLGMVLAAGVLRWHISFLRNFCLPTLSTCCSSGRDATPTALGFGPFPVVFSINLFLWFRPEWFYFQFAIIALGFVAKEFLRWNKEGLSAHIFNPSSFPLAVFSLVLLATGTTDMTWGKEIATTQFYPPHMYLALFLFGLPGQFFFGVTLMTMSAIVTTYLFGLAYFTTTGIYFFYDSYIPISVFLGMHLLFTDPATAPRTESGRIFFGVLYGLSTVLLYQLLGSMGMPTFYDKLLQVPFLNLSIKGIDRIARTTMFRRLDPARLGRSLAPAFVISHSCRFGP
jgi:hypothetical protein